MGKSTAHERASELRSIPQVDRLSGALATSSAQSLRVAAARAAIGEATESILSGDSAPSFDDLVGAANAFLEARSRRRLRPLVNATGVLLHTNLGRAPLSEDALAAIQQVSAGYSNLEFDLGSGKRGSRYVHAAETLISLTGAESALVVNNNAGAVMLALAGLARGREVIISRGELIEIGGEFRIPDIMASSGAVMHEVGTTNRTHLRDYARAITPETGVIMKVHPSNYEVTGFTSSVPGRQLAELAHANGIVLVNDIGSGLLSRQTAGAPPWLGGEPSVTEAIEDGADVVTFSADKLLGGPQAGILVGRAAAMDKLRHDPLLRTYRTDKTTLAALDATLLAYLTGDIGRIPFWRMALLTPGEVRNRAQRLLHSLPQGAAELEVVDGFSTTGGGSAPTSRIPTALIRVKHEAGAQSLAGALLAGNPPVVARIEDGRLIVDLRTVAPQDDALVAQTLGDALTTPAMGADCP